MKVPIMKGFRKKKLVIITNGTLPVPASHGGAAEMLTQTFLDYNEIFLDFDITIFTIGNKSTKNNGKSYAKTKFIVIQESELNYKFGRFVRFALNRIARKKIPNQFLSRVLARGSVLQEADVVLISNNHYFACHIAKHIGSKVPIILHLHNDYINARTGNHRSLAQINKVIAVSSYLMDRVKEVAPGKCKVTFVHNGINLSLFSEKNARKEELITLKYGIKECDFVLVYCGRVQKSKGVKFLLDAFIELSKQSENIKLLIIGSTEYLNSRDDKFLSELKKTALNSGRGKVIFTGFIENENLKDYFHISDLAIIPSAEVEAFGLTSVEAQASGVPVVVTDSGGLGETVCSDSGFIISQNGDIRQQLIEAVDKFRESKSLRDKMTKGALNNSKRFSSECYYLNLRNEIIDA